MGAGRILRIIAVGRNPRKTAIRTVVIAVAAVVVFKFLLLPVRIRGTSMLPTYPDGGFNLINALTYRLGEPERGDVVAIRLAGRSIMYLKRVVGLPGEEIAIQDGVVEVNGKALDEPYVTNRRQWNTDPVRLGGDEYFVVGDNRMVPQRGHRFGRVKRERIEGKAVF